ncbi:hypothetical protein [Photorhabdus hindustanensis]|uniref:Uncharacterized protein n=1 Tax=Photorhabdus hindustanensis TaxID=2918802 RepID=A0A2S8PUY4_9GAMM|nr:hypothetical protein [Photorhabdus hindustanensis]PQQ22670.1 hypothetical protein C6H66_22450 [Photorhabdus hindustanensis]
MNDQVLENGRRAIARECLSELTSLSKYDDKAVTAILDKYTPKFKLIMSEHQKKKASPKNWLSQYVRNLQKECKNG